MQNSPTLFNNVNNNKDAEWLTRNVTAAMTGDADAYERLMDHFAKHILSFVRSFIYDENETEDAVREVVIAVWQSLGTIRSPYAFTSWLRKLMYNVVNDYNDKHSRHSRNRADFELSEGVAALQGADLPCEAALEKDERETMRAFIRRLPDAQRQSLYLHYYEEMSYTEIARLLEVSTQTVGSNIHKAKANLKKMLEQDRKQEVQKERAAARGGRELDALIIGSFALDNAHITERAADSLRAYAHNFDKSAFPVKSAAGKTAGARQGGNLAKILFAVCACACVVLFIAFTQRHEIQPAAQGGVPVHAAPEQVVYDAKDATIEFGGAQAGHPNVNPEEVDVVLGAGDTNVTIDGYSIVNENGAEAASGTGARADIPSLPDGKYFIKYSLTSRGVATATISRSFYITAG